MTNESNNPYVSDNLSLEAARFQQRDQRSADEVVIGDEEVDDLIQRAIKPFVDGYTPVIDLLAFDGDELTPEIAAATQIEMAAIREYSKLIDGRPLEPGFLRELNQLARKYGALSIAAIAMDSILYFNVRLEVSEPLTHPFHSATWRYVPEIVTT